MIFGLISLLNLNFINDLFQSDLNKIACMVVSLVNRFMKKVISNLGKIKMKKIYLCIIIFVCFKPKLRLTKTQLTPK